VIIFGPAAEKIVARFESLNAILHLFAELSRRQSRCANAQKTSSLLRLALPGYQLRGFHQNSLDMLVPPFRERHTHHLVSGAAFISAEAAVTDGLLDRAEVRDISDLQSPGQSCDRTHSWDRAQPLDPGRQQGIALQRSDRRMMEFFYADGDNCTFMRPDTFEQIEVPGVILGAAKNFLQSGMELPMKRVPNQSVLAVGAVGSATQAAAIANNEGTRGIATSAP